MLSVASQTTEQKAYKNSVDPVIYMLPIVEIFVNVRTYADAARRGRLFPVNLNDRSVRR
jgi:hypothetical protein